MNQNFPSRQQIERYRKEYPPGTRIELIHMDDPYSPVPSGTRGTVDHVDAIGQIQIQWDNGSTLPVVPGEDSFRKIDDDPTDVLEKTRDGLDNESTEPVMGM